MINTNSQTWPVFDHWRKYDWFFLCSWPSNYRQLIISDEEEKEEEEEEEKEEEEEMMTRLARMMTRKGLRERGSAALRGRIWLSCGGCPEYAPVGHYYPRYYRYHRCHHRRCYHRCHHCPEYTPVGATVVIVILASIIISVILVILVIIIVIIISLSNWSSKVWQW